MIDLQECTALLFVMFCVITLYIILEEELFKYNRNRILRKHKLDPETKYRYISHKGTSRWYDRLEDCLDSACNHGNYTLEIKTKDGRIIKA